MTECISDKCSIFQISFLPSASLQDGTWVDFFRWGSRKWGGSGQINGLCEIMWWGKRPQVLFYSSAWLLLAHWPSQSHHIHSPELTETLGSQKGMHMKDLEGAGGNVLMLIHWAIFTNQFYTISPALLWRSSWVEGEILPNGEKETALWFKLSLQHLEKYPYPLKHLLHRRSQDMWASHLPSLILLSPFWNLPCVRMG